MEQGPQCSPYLRLWQDIRSKCFIVFKTSDYGKRQETDSEDALAVNMNIGKNNLWGIPVPKQRSW